MFMTREIRPPTDFQLRWTIAGNSAKILTRLNRLFTAFAQRKALPWEEP
jgi:hypothetical protein